jgi:hypothetical protein
LGVAGFVALSGRAEAAAPSQVSSEEYDCSGTLNSLMISHPGSTWIREGNDLVLLSDYGRNIGVPCAAPGQLTSMGRRLWLRSTSLRSPLGGESPSKPGIDPALTGASTVSSIGRRTVARPERSDILWQLS